MGGRPWFWFAAPAWVTLLACPSPEVETKPVCDVRALEAVTKLAEPQRERAVHAAQNIVANCEGALWEPAREMLGDAVVAAERATAPRGGLTDVPDTIDADWDKTLARACPGLRQTLSKSGDLPMEDRNRAIYDACDFQRYAVIDAAELPRTPYTGAFVWSIHQFLLDQGVGAEVSRSLTRSLFDLYSMAHAPYLPPWDVQVPKAEVSSGRALAESDVLISVSASQMRLELPSEEGGARTVVELGEFDAQWESRLRAALGAAGFGPLADAEEATGPDAVVVADRETTFPRLYELLDLLGDTELHWFGVLVEVAPFEYRVLDLGPPSPNTSSIYEGFPVGITDEGFSYTHRIDVPLHSGLRRVDGELDFEGLARAARDRVGNDAVPRVRLLGAPDVPLHEITRTIEALRGPGCDPRAAENCVYSRVSLEQWNWR